MESKVLLLLVAAYWLISVGVAAWFGQMKGRLLEGLALGVLMGPFGTVLAAMLPEGRRRIVAETEAVAHEPRGAAHHEPALAEADVAAHGEHHADEHPGPHGGEHGEALAVEHHEVRTEEAEADEPAERKAGAHRPTWRKGRPRWDIAQIDWGWVFFYGSWALFVGLSWAWLLLFG